MMTREFYTVMSKVLTFVLFLCFLIGGCKAGVFGRFKVDESNIFNEAVQPAQVKKVEKRSLPENPPTTSDEKGSKDYISRITKPIKSAEFVPVKLVERSVKLNNTQENDHKTKTVKPIKSKKPSNKKKKNSVKKSQNLPDSSLNGSGNPKLENVLKKQISASIDLAKNDTGTVASNDTSKFGLISNETTGSNILNQTGFTEFGWFQNNPNGTGYKLRSDAIPDPRSTNNTDFSMESLGDTSDTNVSIHELKSDVSNNEIESIDANVSKGIFPAGSFDFLMNFNVAKNAAMAMEVFNLTDSSLTDHILEENEFHGLLDLMNPTSTDDKKSNLTEENQNINRKFSDNSGAAVKSDKVSEETNMTLQVINGTSTPANLTAQAVNKTAGSANLTAQAVNKTAGSANLTAQAVNETMELANLTEVLQVVNETAERVNSTVLEAVNEMAEWVNSTVLEAVNQTMGWADLDDILEAVSETVAWINTTVLEAVNQTVDRINTTLLVAVNQTAGSINTTGLVTINQTIENINATVFEAVNQTIDKINASVLEGVNQTIERINATALESINQTVTINGTAVEAVNQTERVNTTVLEALNEAVDRINTTVLEAINLTVDRINTTVMEAINQTLSRVNSTDLKAVNQMENLENLTRIEVVGNTTDLNISGLENESEGVSEIIPSNSTSMDTPKCPSPGICLFWFLAQDTCAVNSHCLGSRICCRIGCAKTCIEV